MKANKRMIQQQLSLETGNVNLLKDLSNIMTANKQGKSRNDVDATIQTLMDRYGEFPAWAIKEWVEFCFYCCSWINNEYSSIIIGYE